MKPKRILILNQYFPPDTSATAQWVRDVAEVLAEHHEVTVLAGRPSYQPLEYHQYYLWRRFQTARYTVERVGSTAFHRVRWVGRLANYLSYLALMIPRALMKPTDLIIAMTDPPVVGIVGALIATVRRKPFVYNIQDLHPDMAVAAGIIRPSAWVRWWDRVHRWALQRARGVIVLGDDMRERVIAKGVQPERIAVIRVGAEQISSPGQLPHPVVELIRNGFPFVVCHAGNMGYAGAWDTLVEGILRLQGNGVGFVFIGSGTARSYLESRLGRLPHVRFLAFRPAHELPYVLQAPDLHVITLRAGLEGLVVPSKLYPILMAGRPILAVVPQGSDVARIVQQYRCGIVVSPSDPQSLVEAIQWCQTHTEELKAMGRRARQAADAFSRKHHLALYAATIQCYLDAGENLESAVRASPTHGP